MEQWPLASGHEVLHGSLREVRETNFHSVTVNRRDLQVGGTKQGDQLQQTRNCAVRFVALCHLATSIKIGHPSGHEHTTILCLKFELLNLADSESPSNRQLLTVERVKRVMNRGVARITGIVVE